jgi:energy-coupling factor transporter transmembrane protein EcfT
MKILKYNYQYLYETNYNLYDEYIVMLNIQNRFILFIFGCIPARLFLVFLAKYGDRQIRNLVSVITFLIATGFLIIYFGGFRKTGVETGGNLIWWNDLRPLHSLLYYSFTISNYYNYKNAWQILLLDTFIGLSSFLIFHYRNNDFSKILNINN